MKLEDSIMKEETKGKIVSALVPGHFLLGTRLGDWYEKNPYHRFNEGDILILKWGTGAAGYGNRPVAVVNGYKMVEDFGRLVGRYDITMHRDKGRHIWEDEVSEGFDAGGIERIVKHHAIHFKWNIENHFKRVAVDSVDEALALYASRELEQQ